MFQHPFRTFYGISAVVKIISQIRAKCKAFCKNCRISQNGRLCAVESADEKARTAKNSPGFGSGFLLIAGDDLADVQAVRIVVAVEAGFCVLRDIRDVHVCGITLFADEH